MGTEFDLRLLLFVAPILLHLLWVVIGRGWRVEVIERSRPPVRKRWLPEPYIDVVAITRFRNGAETARADAVEMLFARGMPR